MPMTQLKVYDPPPPSKLVHPCSCCCLLWQLLNLPAWLLQQPNTTDRQHGATHHILQRPACASQQQGCNSLHKEVIQSKEPSGDWKTMHRLAQPCCCDHWHLPNAAAHGSCKAHTPGYQRACSSISGVQGQVSCRPAAAGLHHLAKGSHTSEPT